MKTKSQVKNQKPFHKLGNKEPTPTWTQNVSFLSNFLTLSNLKMAPASNWGNTFSRMWNSSLEILNLLSNIICSLSPKQLDNFSEKCNTYLTIFVHLVTHKKRLLKVDRCYSLSINVKIKHYQPSQLNSILQNASFSPGCVETKPLLIFVLCFLLSWPKVACRTPVQN